MNVFSVLWLYVFTANPVVKDSNRQSYNHTESVQQKWPQGLKIYSTLLWSNNHSFKFSFPFDQS